MVIIQQVRSAWLYKEDFSQEDWARLLDRLINMEMIFLFVHLI